MQTALRLLRPVLRHVTRFCIIALLLAALLALATAAAPLPPETLDEADARLGQPFNPGEMGELDTAEAHWAPAVGWHGDGELVLSADEAYPSWNHEFELDGELVALRWVLWPYGTLADQPLEDQRALYIRLAELLLERYPTDLKVSADPGESMMTYLRYDSLNGRRVDLEWTAGSLLRLTIETAEFGGPHAERVTDELLNGPKPEGAAWWGW